MTVDAPDWLAASEALPLFPTLVWKLQLSEASRDAIAAAFLPYLEQTRRAQPPLQAGEGWQSVQTLHRLEEFRELGACIARATAGILRFLKIGDLPLIVTGSWANVLAPGAAHRMHSHPNNFLSGTYYLVTGPGMDTINFHDPRPQAGIIRPPVTQLTAENTDQAVVAVTAGTLLLFPAFLPHSVDTNQGTGERISLSFNLMFPDFAETLARPLWEPG